LIEGLLHQHARAHRAWQSGKAEETLEALAKYVEFAWRCNQQLALGRFTPLTDQMPKTDEIMRDIEQQPKASCPESLRVITPRVLYALYTIRSKRGAVHVSGEVRADKVDAQLSLQMADWFLAEVVRVLGKLPLGEGQALVDSLVQRQIPVVHRDEEIRIVTRSDLSLDDEILVLLYSEPLGLTEGQVIESARAGRNRVRNAIERLLQSRWAYKTRGRPYRIRLLPPGELQVEERGLLVYPTAV